MRGSRGNLQNLISPILLKMKKIVIFHICALPQLYVKQNQSYLRLDPPPWKNFLVSAPDIVAITQNSITSDRSIGILRYFSIRQLIYIQVQLNYKYQSCSHNFFSFNNNDY